MRRVGLTADCALTLGSGSTKECGDDTGIARPVVATEVGGNPELVRAGLALYRELSAGSGEAIVQR
jgi:hypothetical protein